MPTYEYSCSKCKASYELRQGFDAPTEHPCEECGKGRARRVLVAPRIVFKGSGWYATDSKKTTSEESGSSSDEPKKKTSVPSKAKANETSGGGGDGASSSAASTPESSTAS